MAISLIIEHGNTKRKIEGPFNLCMDRQTAKLLFNALKERVDDDGNNYGYGWISISENQPSIANTSPEPWDATSSAKATAQKVRQDADGNWRDIMTGVIVKI